MELAGPEGSKKKNGHRKQPETLPSNPLPALLHLISGQQISIEVDDFLTISLPFLSLKMRLSYSSYLKINVNTMLSIEMFPILLKAPHQIHSGRFFAILLIEWFH